MKRLHRAITVIVLAAACVGGAGNARAGDEGGSRLRVDYHAPRLTVEARGVTLAQMLGEIGARVGFTVVDNGASATLLSVSIEDALVDEVLRQLLRGENHTVLYAAGGNTPGIDKIVLLGAPGQFTAGVEPPNRQQPQGTQPVAAQPAVSPPAASVAVTPSAVPASATADPTPPSGEGRASVPAADPANAPVTVGEMLKAHAMVATQAGQETAQDAPLPAPPMNIDAVLAETTLRAQQSLSALMDGLAAATRSLQESLAAGRK
ncbi:MAG TPA: hypothetical protein VGT40_10220 [Methylomirabilota bacterium]|jgi:hypothetical protein|nr:hypothetical protein [Methylomirabilota bacterium]